MHPSCEPVPSDGGIAQLGDFRLARVPVNRRAMPVGHDASQTRRVFHWASDVSFKKRRTMCLDQLIEPIRSADPLGNGRVEKRIRQVDIKINVEMVDLVEFLAFLAVTM